MTRYILHIGTHKTGTTSIQAFLSHNRQSLLDQGIDFPLLGRVERGAQAHRHFSALIRGVSNEHPNKFGEDVAAGFTKSQTCILSSEDFWYCSNNESIERAFKLLGENVSVICYLREPIAHVISMYRESLKGCQQHSIAEFFEEYADKLQSMSNSYYHYEQNVLQWTKRWPTIVRAYSGRCNVVTDFLSYCGISIDSSELVVPARENEGMPATSAMLLMRINRMLANGSITQKERKELKKEIERNRSRLHEEFSDLLIMQEISAGAFKDAFYRHNRYISSTWESNDAFVHAIDIDMTDDQILDAFVKPKPGTGRTLASGA